VRQIADSAAPIRNTDGHICGVVLVFHDITAEYLIKKALRDSEEKYRSVVERVNDGIVILQDGIIVFANPSLAAMLGYETSEIEGGKLSLFIPQDNLGLVLERYRKRMAGDKLSATFETVLLHKSGKKIFVQTSGGVIQYKGNQQT